MKLTIKRRRRHCTGVEIRHRNELDTVQRELREVTGHRFNLCTTCASEKRRRRNVMPTLTLLSVYTLTVIFARAVATVRKIKLLID